MRIRAAVPAGPDRTLARRGLRIETVELEPPRAEEVLVRVTSRGVCGTDRGCLHALEPSPTPGVLGHEGTGIVEEAGTGVSPVRPVRRHDFTDIDRAIDDGDAGEVVKPILHMA